MLGSSSSQNLTLSNAGSVTVTISQAAVTGNGFSILGGTSSIAIAAGQTHTFQVQFSPKASGSASGAISVASDATNPSLDVSLSGTGMTPLTISSQPQGQTVTAGQTATFAVTAAGTGTLTYQWRKNGSNIGGATAASYATPATTISDNGSQFSVVVTDADGNLTSNPAILTVTTAPVAPSIVTEPASRTVTAGQTATFNVAVTGTSPLSYQWKKNGAVISGATAPSYTTPATTSADNGAQFTVTVSNSAGNTTSNVATLTVAAATFVLNVSQTSLAFGNVNIGLNSVLPVTLTNAGNSSVAISNVSLSGAGFTVGGVSSGQILTAGQRATLNVTFGPSSAGPVNGSVTVTSNATSSPAVIALSGTGVQAVLHSITLSWTASASSVTGYNIYRSQVSGGPYTKQNSALLTSTTYTDTAVLPGLTYYYVVTSADSNGMESVHSNEVSAAVP